jgi:hypothetical protein
LSSAYKAGGVFAGADLVMLVEIGIIGDELTMRTERGAIFLIEKPCQRF